MLKGEYSDEELLQLSGIQHYAFCPRQWALIHIEGLWNENYLTVSGRRMHDKAHDASKTEKRGNIIVARGLSIASHKLGISGQCDTVEFHKESNGISLKNWEGLYQPFPVEYKRGERKTDDCDRLQICAQAMCLEEMLSCDIHSGAIFYGKQKRREQVAFTPELRQMVIDCLEKMHELFARQHTPIGKVKKCCKSCSMAEVCLPHITRKTTPSVEKYLEDALQ